MIPTAYTLSDIAHSHESEAFATVLRNGNEETGTVRVLGGKVTVDASAAVRRRCNGFKLLGYRPDLDPYTCELKLWRSVNGEAVPLGVFRMEDPEYEDDAESPTTGIDLFDRSYWVSSLRLPTPYSIAANTLLHVAIQMLISSRAPGLDYDFAVSSYRVPATTFEEQSDPWEKAMLLAEAGGMELFFDPNGVCRLRPVAAADSSSVVAAFGDTARILDASRQLITGNTYSRAIATGDNTNIDVPLRSEAVDNDPSSPTYYLGPFGDRPTWLRSQFITTQDQCDAAARALLARSRGRAEVVKFNTIPNPAMDANDVVSIYRPEIGVDAIHVIDTMTIPLEAKSAMNATTRERKLA